MHCLLPRDRLNFLLLGSFLALWAVSCIRVPYPQYFWMQHVPTVLAVVGLVAAERWQHLDRVGFALAIAFLLLHLVGARYLYSYVPYDDWTHYLFGFRLGESIGFSRNHYDRLVHFCFGLLFACLVGRILVRRADLNRWRAALMAMCIVLAASAVYEIGEWIVAATFAPDWADAYNGQQGDPWDAQRDMALAWVGAMVGTAVVVLLVQRRKTPEGSL